MNVCRPHTDLPGTTPMYIGQYASLMGRDGRVWDLDVRPPMVGWGPLSEWIIATPTPWNYWLFYGHSRTPRHNLSRTSRVIRAWGVA